MQNANVSNNIDSTTRHTSACTPGGNAVPLESAQCSDTAFNLSWKVLTSSEIRILEKGFDLAPIQNKLNESELRTDFEEFCHRMRTKWHFRNEPTPEISETPVF